MIDFIFPGDTNGRRINAGQAGNIINQCGIGDDGKMMENYLSQASLRSDCIGLVFIAHCLLKSCLSLFG